jgi:hypothetical protein
MEIIYIKLFLHSLKKYTNIEIKETPSSFAAAKTDYKNAFLNLKCKEYANVWEVKCHPYTDKDKYGLILNTVE